MPQPSQGRGAFHSAVGGKGGGPPWQGVALRMFVDVRDSRRVSVGFGVVAVISTGHESNSREGGAKGRVGQRRNNP